MNIYYWHIYHSWGLFETLSSKASIQKMSWITDLRQIAYAFVKLSDYGLIGSAGEDRNELSFADSKQRFGSVFGSQQETGVESFRHTLSVNAWQKVLHAATPVCSVNFSICVGVPGQTRTNFSFNTASSFRILVLLSPVWVVPHQLFDILISWWTR